MLTKKELIQQLLDINHRLAGAAAAVAQERDRLNELIDQVHLHMPEETVVVPAATPVAPVAPLASSATPAPLQRRSPPPLDFSDQTLADVPQSPLSRIPVGPAQAAAPRRQLPFPGTVINQQGEVIHQGPTEEVAAQPTEEVAAPPAAPSVREQFAARQQEQLGHLFGVGSLFARFLSPEVIVAGKGMIKPQQPGTIKKYSNDIAEMLPERLKDWPTGFYRDAKNSQLQLLLHTTKGLVRLPDLSRADQQQPVVALKRLGGEYSDWAAADQLELMDLLIVIEAVKNELTNLTSQIHV